MFIRIIAHCSVCIQSYTCNHFWSIILSPDVDHARAVCLLFVVTGPGAIRRLERM